MQSKPLEILFEFLPNLATSFIFKLKEQNRMHALQDKSEKLQSGENHLEPSNRLFWQEYLTLLCSILVSS